MATLVVLGILARFALAACSWGTNDTVSFYRFGLEIERNGLLQAYRIDSDLNHPPIPAYWAWLAVRVTRPADADQHSAAPEGEDDSAVIQQAYTFAFVFRSAVILADIGSIWLLFRLWKRRSGSAAAWNVAALYAWCPAAMFISGYHCNTDPVYAFLCLLSVYLIEASGAAFLGGLALGAAINVKLIPVLLIVPLLLSFRRWTKAAKFIGGLIPGALTFVPPLLWAGESFARNALAYKSSVVSWGIHYFLLLGAPPDAPSHLPPGAQAYHVYGRWVLLAAVLGWAVFARVRGRWNRYDLAAVTFALFLILAPGFGVQYTIILIPLLFATRVRPATVYGICAGLFLFCAYLVYWTGEFPISSLFNRNLPEIVGAVGLLPWGALIAYVGIVLHESAGRRAIAA